MTLKTLYAVRLISNIYPLSHYLKRVHYEGQFIKSLQKIMAVCFQCVHWKKVNHFNIQAGVTVC